VRVVDKGVAIADALIPGRLEQSTPGRAARCPHGLDGLARPKVSASALVLVLRHLFSPERKQTSVLTEQIAKSLASASGSPGTDASAAQVPDESDTEIVGAVGVPSVHIGLPRRLIGTVGEEFAKELRVAGRQPGGVVAAREQRRRHREPEQAGCGQQPDGAIEHRRRCVADPEGREGKYRGRLERYERRELASGSAARSPTT
jgi:hypothetical protein